MSVVAVTNAKPCPWCGRKIHPHRLACYIHVDVERIWLRLTLHQVSW